MSEFQEKVEELKNTIQQPGFTVPDDFGEEVPGDSSPEDESASEVPQEEQERKQERRSHTRRESLKQKLNQARYESKLKDEQNQHLLAQLQEKERLLAEKQYQVEEAVNNDHNRYLNTLMLREQSVINELKVAKEEGDTQKEVELTRDMAQIVADKSTYDLYKSQMQTQQQQSREYEDAYSPQPYVNQVPYQQPYNDYEEPENEHQEDFLERNPWADPGSSNYSPRLRGELEELADRFNKALDYKGLSEVIGTPQYYDSLDTIMRERYDTSNEQPPQNSEYSGSSMVAPVSRSGSSMSDHYVSKHPNNTRGGLSLTKEEYALARNLLQTPNGRTRSSAQAIKLYQEGKEYKGGIDALHPNRYSPPE